MAKVTDDSIDISVPFAIPFLGIPEPTTISINKANLQFVVRLIVVVCAYLLFRPKIAGAFRTAFGKDDEAEKKEVQERIAKLEYERSLAGQGDGKAKKSYGVATRAGGGEKATSGTADNTGTAAKGSAKKRKA